MSNDFTQLNSGLGGDFMDESLITYPDDPQSRKRARVVIGGDNLPDEICSVTNTTPNTTDYALVTRPIQWQTAFPGTSINQYGNAAVVSAEIETTIATLTVPSNVNFYPTGFVATGNLDGKFTMYINSQVVLVARSTAANLNVSISFLGASPVVTPTSIVRVTIIHNADGFQGSFDATILGYNV